jgi:hypothetical protein
MTIEKIKEDKKTLEKEILASIQKFENETQLYVESIRLTNGRFYQERYSPLTLGVSAEVKLIT